ncbi:MAG TPA: ROK family protein [Acidisarcina sp.]
MYVRLNSPPLKDEHLEDEHVEGEHLEEETLESVVAIDVGGSHVSAATYNFRARQLGEVHEIPISLTAAADEFMDALVSLCRAAESGIVGGLSIAMPNPFDYQHGISYMTHKLKSLYGIDLRHGLSARLQCEAESIHFLNDAAAYLIGEVYQGAARGVDRVVVITLGTGIGSAFATGGEVAGSGPGVPAGGEIWNLPYREGIVEDWAGTAAIQRLHLEATGEHASVRDIAAAAGEGNPAARETFARFGRDLGKLLHFATADFAPQRIVIGGGIARSAHLFLADAQGEVAELGIELRVSELSDRAPLIGAAIAWKRHHSDSGKQATPPAGAVL